MVETVAPTQLPDDKASIRLLEKEFLQISDVPHPVKGQPYAEPWRVLETTSDNTTVDPEHAAAMEEFSPRIPGAIVVSPMLREAAEEKGLESSNHAMWLLTVALREHTKNILKGSIAHKKAMEKGEIHPPFLHYPNILASTGKKEGKHVGEVAPSIEGGRKKRISALDIFSASQGLPAGQIGSLGGAISRLAFEQSLQSAFSSVPTFTPGKESICVRNFITKEMLEKADTPSLNPADDTVEILPGASQAKAGKRQNPNPSIELAITPQGNSTVIKADSSLNPVTVETRSDAIENDIPSNDLIQLTKSPVVASGTLSGDTSSAKPASEEFKKPFAGNPPLAASESSVQKSIAGIGRGAKDLAALMARASETTVQNEGTTKSSIDVPNQFGKVDIEESMSSSAAESTNIASAKFKGESDDRTREESGTIDEGEKNRLPVVGEVTANPEQPSPSPNPEKEQQQGNVQSEKEDVNALESTESNVGMSRGFKGKGFGTKDLAAMRSRSISQPNPAAEKHGKT